MWIWRKMEKISWTAKVSNSEVLNRVKENSCIINTINQWKRRWLGHVFRHDVLLWDILEGRMTGKCTRGRKRPQLMSNICEGYETAKKRAEDRCLWCVAVMGVSDLLNSRMPEYVNIIYVITLHRLPTADVAHSMVCVSVYLAQKTVKHVNWTGRMLWIIVDCESW